MNNKTRQGEGRFSPRGRIRDLGRTGGWEGFSGRVAPWWILRALKDFNKRTVGEWGRQEHPRLFREQLSDRNRVWRVDKAIVEIEAKEGRGQMVGSSSLCHHRVLFCEGM